MTEQEHTQQAPDAPPTVAGSTDHTTASAAGADAETTIVPSDPATVDALAWSQGDELDDDERHPWGRVLAIAAGVLALGGVAAVVLATSGRHTNDLHESALPVTVHPTVAARPAVVPSVPPAVTTVTAPPVTVTETPTAQPALTTTAVVEAPVPTTYVAPVVPFTPAPVTAADAEFLHLITDSDHPWVGAYPVQTAFNVCNALGGPFHPHVNEVITHLAHDASVPWDTANTLVSAAITMYCKQYTFN
jgi:hypothetical protein